MQHIDEHTLELFVLDAPEVRERREAVQRHLRECLGCSSVVKDMEVFHSELAIELARQEDAKPVSETALVRSARNLEQYRDVFAGHRQVEPRTRTGQIRYFIRRNPVVTALGTLGLTATLAVIINLLFFAPRNRTANSEPSYPFLNEEKGTLEIYSENREQLWSSPAYGIRGAAEREKSSGIRQCAVHDLDGDDHTEVVTTLQLPDQMDNRGGFLRIYDWQMNLRAMSSLDRPIRYLDRKYDPQFRPACLVLIPGMRDGRSDVLVASGNTRSPSYLSRFNPSGETVGEFWHFGHLGTVYKRAFLGPEKDDLFVFGINDVEDRTHQEFPVMLVLDPSRIVTIARSTATPGFELPASTAELFYVRLPKCDMDLMFGINPSTSHVEFQDREYLFVTLGSIAPDAVYLFTYVFDPGMHLIQVKSNNTTDLLHARLVKEGRLRGSLDETYLAGLGRQVTYWDGLKWQSAPVRVNSSSRSGATE